ncbi:MAG: hypothetical protein QOF85_970 [Solirubrobacterales bacterium]|jgi:DNA-directed RNA polymerase specialized sigma24 family protein|nr:hypothetical protein [Solirubrobacterales bacterium]
MELLPLRDRLKAFALELADLEAQLRGVRSEIGAALLEVRGTEGFTLTEAAQILGFSRPTVYCLLEDAEG